MNFKLTVRQKMSETRIVGASVDLRRVTSLELIE